MTQMADVVGAQPKCSEESKNGHEDDDGAHAHGYGKREKINPSVRKENGASDKNSKNGPGSADRGSRGGQGDPVTEGRRRYFDNHVDEARANAREEVITHKAAFSPRDLAFPAKHPKHEHVHQ